MSMLRAATRSGCRTGCRVGTVNMDQRKLLFVQKKYFFIFKIKFKFKLFAPIRGQI